LVESGRDSDSPAFGIRTVKGKIEVIIVGLVFGRKINCGFSDILLGDRLHQKTRRADEVLVIKVKAIFVLGECNVVRSRIE